MLTELNEAIARVPEWMRPVIVRTPIQLLGTRSRIEYEPRGVVLIMAAWNYPFALIFAPLVAAVAAGNCAMLRPSERVPRTSAVARRIVEETFDPDEVVMIGGDLRSAQALLDLPFDHVFFTGSTPVGRKIMSAAASHLSSVTLELGGKAPALVDETADIEHAARSIMWGKFVNAGQTCVAPDYAFVHESKAEAFFDASRRMLASFYGATDDARQASPDYCRMIDVENWTRVAGLIEESVRAGATNPGRWAIGSRRALHRADDPVERRRRLADHAGRDLRARAAGAHVPRERESSASSTRGRSRSRCTCSAATIATSTRSSAGRPRAALW